MRGEPGTSVDGRRGLHAVGAAGRDVPVAEQEEVTIPGGGHVDLVVSGADAAA